AVDAQVKASADTPASNNFVFMVCSKKALICAAGREKTFHPSKALECCGHPFRRRWLGIMALHSKVRHRAFKQMKIHFSKKGK
ncbi:MAG: hypothetical protein ACO3NE_09620, partial [Alphaproteobacteria bacterium]